MKTDMFSTNNDTYINNCTNKLKKGGIGIFPTDTVYGIGCDALNLHSLERLYSVKKRNLNKPICILISNIKMLNAFAKNINPIEKKLIECFWPGPLTIIFNKSDIVPDILTSNQETVGIRMPKNKTCLELIESFGSALATSSANISNKPPFTSINETLIKDFENEVDFIIDDGQIENGIPSTIVKIENNKVNILREGTITMNDINKCLGGFLND